jgi:hypothetical protein
MVSAVRPRANHYETLGLSPSASDYEIRAAFARMMGMFGAHPVVAATSVSAAFEVLRNPEKRRAYDKTLGLTAEPESGHWRVGGVGWSTPGSTGAPWAPPARQETSREAPDKRHPVEAAEVPPAEPRLASFISSSLRDLARPVAPEVARDTAPPEPHILPSTTASPSVQPSLPAPPSAEREMVMDGEASPLDLRRPALIAVGAIAVAGLVGALAGASVGDMDQQPSPAKRGVTVPLPVAAAKASSELPSRLPAARVVERAVPAPRVAVAESAPAAGRLAMRQQDAATAAPTVGQIQSAGSELAVNAPAEEAAPVESRSAAPKAIAASLPLPNRVVARTIARIGYSCGTVVSTTSVEGAGPGVYKVACSSGETFHATPVRGRYRFRRAGQ